MKPIVKAGLLAISLLACSGGSDGTQKPDPFAACAAQLTPCTVSWSGADTGSVACSAAVTHPSGVFDLQISGPPGIGYVGYPNALGVFGFSAAPAAGTYQGSDLLTGGTQVVASPSLSWQAQAGAAGSSGSIVLEITDSTSWHGRFAATLLPGSASASGTVSVCAVF